MKRIQPQTPQNTGRISPSLAEEAQDGASAAPSGRTPRGRRASLSSNSTLSDFVESRTGDDLNPSLLLPTADYEGAEENADSLSDIQLPEADYDIDTSGGDPRYDPEIVLGDVSAFMKGNPPFVDQKGALDKVGVKLEEAGKQLENNEGTPEEQAAAAKEALSALKEQVGQTGKDKPVSEAHQKKLKLLEERIDRLDDKKKLGTCLLNIGLILLQMPPLPLDDRAKAEAKDKLNDLEDETPVEETEEEAPVEETEEKAPVEEVEEETPVEEAEAAAEPEAAMEPEPTLEPEPMDEPEAIGGAGEPNDIDDDEDDDDINIIVEQNNNNLDGNLGATGGTGAGNASPSQNTTPVPSELGDDDLGSGLGDDDLGEVFTHEGTTSGDGMGADNEGKNDSDLTPPSEPPPPPPAPPKKWKLTPMDSAGIARRHQIGPSHKPQMNFGMPLSQQANILNALPKISSFLDSTAPMDPKGGVTRSASVFSRSASTHKRPDFSKPIPKEPSTPEQRVLQQSPSDIITQGQVQNDQRPSLTSTATLEDVKSSSDESTTT